MAVGLGGELQHHFAGVDIALDFRHALGDTFGMHPAIEFGELLHFHLGVPANALAAVAHFFKQWPQSREALEGVGVVALDHRNAGRRLAGDQIALAALPVAHAKGLGQLGRGVVHERRQHHFFFHTQMAHTDLAKGFGKALVNVPIALALPGRVYRRGERVDEGMHVAGVQIVLLVPGSSGQHDVGIQAGGAHAKVQRDQEVELAFGRILVPLHLGRLGIISSQIFALHAVGGAQQMLHEIFMALAGRSQ